MSLTNILKFINYIETLIHKISELILIHIVPNIYAIPPAELELIPKFYVSVFLYSLSILESLLTTLNLAV